MEVNDINDVSDFLESEREEYVAKKLAEYLEKGMTREEAVNRANQSWRTYIGARIQDVVRQFIEKRLEGTGLKVITDKNLLGKKLSREFELVKRKLAINYGRYLFLPDADIILYRVLTSGDVEILAIVSVKNSFRERGFETAYWKLKLSQSPVTSHIKVFLATPDKDGEIAFISPKEKPKKMRVILEWELDGIYFLREDFEKTEKAKHFSEIIKDIKKLITR